MSGENRIKRYVCVTTRTDEDGRMRPMSVQWYNGETYPIDKIHKVARESSEVGGDGICYTVDVCGKRTKLFHEDPKWFVEEKREYLESA